VGGQLLIVSEPTPVNGGYLNQPYPPESFKAIAGVEPYTWTFVSGQVPPGLQWAVTSDQTVSRISGTPTTAGVYSFTLKVTDGLGYTDTEEYVIPIGTLGGNNAVSISTQSLPAGQAGVAYPSTQLLAAGGTAPYNWSVSRGQLPPGLALSASGTISGMPTSAGNWSADLSVRDSTGSAATRGYSVAITPAPLAVTTTSLPSATVNSTYDVTLAAAGGTGPYTWVTSNSVLPKGLALDAHSGVISGTPSQSGSFSLNFLVIDSTSKSAQKTLMLAVSAPSEPSLRIITQALPSGSTGSAYSFAVTASGGTQPYTWALTNGFLPAGLILQRDGVVTGTPGEPGDFQFTLQTTDAANNQVSAPFTLTISAPPPPQTTVVVRNAQYKNSGRLIVTGSGFGDEPSVTVDGRSVTLASSSATRIVIKHLNLAPGDHKLVVKDATTGEASEAFTFTLP
ncbi:MAG: Ig domain-containing protein, partial [Blastocatellia bacterium]